MKPYLKTLSHRPGCTCCNVNKGLHSYHPRHGDNSVSTVAAKRAGKKQVRQALKKFDEEE